MMKPCDSDKDSAMGFSIFTGGKSTTLSDVSCVHTPLTSNLDLSLWYLYINTHFMAYTINECYCLKLKSELLSALATIPQNNTKH